MDVAMHEEAVVEVFDQAVEGSEPAVRKVVFLAGEPLRRRVREQYVYATPAPSAQYLGDQLDPPCAPPHLGFRVLIRAWLVAHRSAEAGDAKPGPLHDATVDAHGTLGAFPWR